MKVNWYALSIEPDQIVATIIDSELAAKFLVSAHPVFLGTVADLIRLASRQHKSVAVLGYVGDAAVDQHAEAGSSSGWEASQFESAPHVSQFSLAVA